MASIQKRGKNSYYLIIELGYDANGKRLKKTKTIHVDDQISKRTRRLKEHLELELAKFKMEVESGQYISLEKMTFAQFSEEWKTRFLLKKLESKSIENYLFQLNRRILPYFSNMVMEKIKTMHIMDYLDRLETDPSMRFFGEGPLGASTVAYNYRVLRSIFRWAKDWKVIKENPMEGVPARQDGSREMEVYSEEEVQLLFIALSKENLKFRCLIMLALTTGLRRGELLGLEWKHIDLDKGLFKSDNLSPCL